MVPYMTFAWPTYSELLRAWASNAPEDGDLWIAVLQTVTKALAADEDRGTFSSLPKPRDI